MEEGPTKKEFLTREEILALAPGKLAEYLDTLDQSGQLEEYLRKALQDDSLLAHISYWEKWYKREKQTLIDDIVHERFARESVDWELPLGLEKRYSEEELRLIFINLLAFQLTFGCSKGCPNCGYDAPPGIRDQLPFEQIKNLADRYGRYLFDTYLHHASEPSDYYDEKSGKRYQDVHELIREVADFDPLVSTREVDDKDWQEFLKEETDRARLSIQGLTSSSLSMIEEAGLGKMEKTGDVMVKGLGVSRRDTGEKPEERGEYLGIGSYVRGPVITPRGLYNHLPTILSDEFPQGSVMVPIEKINNEEPRVGDSIIEICRHKIVEGKKVSTKFERKLHKLMIGVMVEEKAKFSPQMAVIQGLTKKWLVSYDIDGRIDEILVPDRTRINEIAQCSFASGQYRWRIESDIFEISPEQELSEQEMDRLRFYLISEEIANVKPIDVRKDLVLWQIKVPEVGRVVIFLHDRPRADGEVSLGAFKEERDVRITDGAQKGSLTSP
ncbi:MAG: hypothetical protein WC640_02965 [Candidatus Paceibacterota bacterium]|jgi:hypothetical protein